MQTKKNILSEIIGKPHTSSFFAQFLAFHHAVKSSFFNADKWAKIGANKYLFI